MTGHDPFRARSSAAPEGTLLGVAGPALDDDSPEECPDLAADVAAWIGAAKAPEEGSLRADEAWTIETARSAGVRKTVADAVARALGAAESASGVSEAGSDPKIAGGQECAQEPAVRAS